MCERTKEIVEFCKQEPYLSCVNSSSFTVFSFFFPNWDKLESFDAVLLD